MADYELQFPTSAKVSDELGLDDLPTVDSDVMSVSLRGMLSFLAVNTTYRGPATPGSAAALAFGMAVPDENAKLMKKLRGESGR
jgi:hypothetical protein